MGVGASVRFGSVKPIFNLALERLLPSHMYSMMGILGVFIASRGLGLEIYDILPVLTITFSAMGLYVINDVFDLEIDKVSHPERSLPQGKVTIRQALIFGILLLIAGPVFALIINPAAGLLVGMITVIGVLYSVPPVRLRKYPVIPSVMIGFMVLFSFVAGAAFKVPITGKILFGGLVLWAFFALHSPIKDIDQEEGDKVGGVMTLPVLLGNEMALKVTVVFGLSSIVFPILFIVLFDLHWIFILAIIMLYIADGYSLLRYAKSRNDPSPESRQINTDQTIDRLTFNPWLVKVFGCFLGMQITLVIASLI